MALLACVAVAVAAGTVAHLVEVSSRLERDLASQALRVTAAIRTDLEQTATALDEELAVAADPRAGIARLLSSGRLDTRFLGAQSRLISGRLEVLKVLLRDGTILMSGHWPASFGALDPLVTAYVSDPGRLPRVVDEATPQGSSPALERWTTVRSGGRELVVVAGRFLDAPALERLRARTGADLLALCAPSVQARNDVSASDPCLVVRAETLLGDILDEETTDDGDDTGINKDSSGKGDAIDRKRRQRTSAIDSARFHPTARSVTTRLRLDVIDVGGLLLYVGLDRSGIETVRSGIIGRAVIVGFLSVLFAVLLGALVTRRIVAPIEDLADAAGRVAAGDLKARVPDPRAGGEVQALVEAFNLMAQDLEQGQRRLLQAERVAAWQEIARGLAHELKNPLTPILSAIDVIKRAHQLGRKDFDAILAEQASAVVEEVMRLKELADAFARFARLPEKKPEPLIIQELLDHALALYASIDGVVIQRSFPDDLPALVADRTQMLTVLTNLVKNAAEAMDGPIPTENTKADSNTHDNGEGEGDGDAIAGRILGVGARLDEGGHEMIITVDDSGPGIAPTVQDRLFTPYVTTKGSRGTGLGLALVHRIVAEHQGSIEAGRSHLGGARFRIRLPVESPAGSKAPATTEGNDETIEAVDAT